MKDSILIRIIKKKKEIKNCMLRNLYRIVRI